MVILGDAVTAAVILGVVVTAAVILDGAVTDKVIIGGMVTTMVILGNTVTTVVIIYIIFIGLIKYIIKANWSSIYFHVGLMAKHVHRESKFPSS